MRKLLNFRMRSNLRGLLLIFLSFFTAFILYYTLPNLFNSWNYQITDQLFKIRYSMDKEQKVSPFLIHIDLVDSDLESHNITIWDRTPFGKIITGLSNNDVKVIGIDFIFRHKPENPALQQGDSAFVKAVKESANTYLPLFFRQDTITTDLFKDQQIKRNLVKEKLWHPRILRRGSPPRATDISTSYPGLLAASKGTGHINNAVDSDGIIRMMPMLFEHEEGYIPSFSLALVCGFLEVPPENIEVSFGSHILLKDATFPPRLKKDIKIPIDREGKLRINFLSPWNDFFYFETFAKMLEEEHNSFYANAEEAIVLLSDTSTGTSDLGPGIFNEVFPLNRIHSYVINSILTENFIFETGIIHNFFACVFLIFLFRIVSFRLKSYLFFLSSIITGVLFFIYGVWLFISFHILFEMIPLLLGIIFSGIIVVLYQFYLEEQNKNAFRVRAESAREIEVLNLNLNIKNRELEAANEKLRETESYKNIFFQNISHDFRTPLSLIIESVKYFLEKRKAEVPLFLTNTLKRMNNYAHKVLFLINQVLDLSRLEAGQVKLVIRKLDAVRLFRSVTGSFEFFAKRKQVKIEFKSVLSELTVHADHEKIEQIIYNLLFNAFKHVDVGGSITLILGSEQGESGKLIVVVSVIDDGCGIPEGEIPHIFDRFKQAGTPSGAVYGSTGIGLALAKEYLELHAGEIDVKSQVDVGTEFTIRFPAKGQELSPGELEYEDPEMAAVFPVVYDLDDGPSIEAVLVFEAGFQLKERAELMDKYRTAFAVKSRDALKKARTLLPDLIIVAGNDVESFIHSIKKDKATSFIPLLYIAGDDSGTTERGRIEAEVDASLISPVGPGVLLKCAGDLIKMRPHYDTTLLRGNRKKYLLATRGKFPATPILIVDDDRDVLEHYQLSLFNSGIDNLILCRDSNKALEILLKQEVPLVILDLYMPGALPGRKLLKLIKEQYPSIPVIIVTGLENIDTAVRCLKAGAYDYMTKPVEFTRLVKTIHNVLRIGELEKEINRLGCGMNHKALKNPEIFSRIITCDENMHNIFKYIESIAGTPMPVLITGETGTGKELVARAIHNASKRSGKFVIINIAGLDDSLFSDTLFGHKKDAFTGASKDRKGLIEQARDGTLFLDEIGDLSPDSQVKLLRLIQHGQYYPLGSDREEISNARILTATNVDVMVETENSRFRKDLYFRLISHHIHLPPLRQRGENDFVLLTKHFVKSVSGQFNRPVPGIPDSLYSILYGYNFPGNIRELEEIIKNAVSIQEGDMLSENSFKEYINKHLKWVTGSQDRTGRIIRVATASGEFPKMSDVKSHLIKNALKLTKGNQSAAAKLLGMTQPALSILLKKNKQ